MAVVEAPRMQYPARDREPERARWAGRLFRLSICPEPVAFRASPRKCRQPDRLPIRPRPAHDRGRRVIACVLPYAAPTERGVEERAMQDFAGRVAVVTGAASGIGRGIAARFAAEGMKVVLADVEQDALDTAVRALRRQERDVIGVRVDTADAGSVDGLRDRALDAYGAVHIVCNNAGVSGGGGAVWESSLKDWQWVLGVNLWGVIHGIRAFVPLLLEQGEPAWVVNTASVLGLQSGGGSPYGVSKHAVVRLTEGLYYDLKARDAKVGCSVLCPGMVATRIIEAERNRPSALAEATVEDAAARRRDEMRTMMSRRFQEFGMPPARVGDMVLDAIRAERFYILTHPDNVKERVRARMEDILAERAPSPLPAAGDAMGMGPGAGSSGSG